MKIEESQIGPHRDWCQLYGSIAHALCLWVAIGMYAQ